MTDGLIHFDKLGWLALLLFVPVLATAAVIMARLRSRQWSDFVADRLRQRLVSRHSPIPRWIGFTCLLFAIALLALTLARPQSETGTLKESIEGRNILIVLDLSRSMKVDDVRPDRLSQAKALCFELLDLLPNDRIGLVGFAGTSYLFAPLTVDHSAVRETLTEIDIDWIPTGGSSLEEGLSLGVETLKASGTHQNAIILLSDGEEHEGDIAEIAEEARNANIEIITVGFGTEEGSFVPDSSQQDGRFRDRNGREVISTLETSPLERIAQITGGRFAIATSGADIPAMVETAVSDLERVRVGERESTVTRELYQWFLLPVILLLMTSIVVATRWRGAGQPSAATLTLLLGLLFFSNPAEASLLKDAKHAMEESRFEDAVTAYDQLAREHYDQEKGFRFALAKGTAAYQLADWTAAREAFSEALRSTDPATRAAAHHGMGNALFQIGWERLSGGKHYPEVAEQEEPEDEEGDDTAFDLLSDALLEKSDKPAETQMERFETMVKERLSEWMKENSESKGTSRGAQRFSKLLSDWVDSAHHHGEATDLSEAKHNRDVTIRYLDKLREILNQTEDNAEQIRALPQSGEGQPQQDGQSGEGGPGSEGNGRGDEEQEGPRGEEDEDGEGGDEESEERDNSGQPEDSEEDADTGAKEGETPEEAARRILEENSDAQKGALSPGRRRHRQPDKDW